jgi:hypothetical protein
MIQAAGKQQMTRLEMEEIQLVLLSKVQEQLRILTPIYSATGHCQVEDLEHDMVLFGQLLMESVKFQYQDFFGVILRKLGVEAPEDFGKMLNTVLSEHLTSASTSSDLS